MPGTYMIYRTGAKYEKRVYDLHVFLATLFLVQISTTVKSLTQLE